MKTTSTWKEISEYKSEKSSLTKLITLRSKKAFKLTEMKFKWTGKPVKNMSISLYKKKKEKDRLIPIQQNIVSDGVWDENKQEISFNMDEKLVAVNKYYLILSYPPKSENRFKSGKLVLASPFKVSAIR